MTVAIHQPNYLPWLGYFYKIWAADAFIFLDDVQQIKGSYTKRTRIRKKESSAEYSYLTVPLTKHSNFALIKDLLISSNEKWSVRHLNKLKSAYAHAPFYQPYLPFIEDVLGESRAYERLAGYNRFCITQLLDLLEIRRAVYASSDIKLPPLKAGEYIASLTAAVGGSVYLSGVGAKKYQSAEPFVRRRIELRYCDFGHFLQSRPYPQTQGAFLNGLSVVDALFNIGKEGIIALFEAYAASGSANDA